MVELERRGVPTVLFAAQAFVHDAHRSAASFGLAGLPLAVVPLPFTNQKPGDVHRMAERAFEQVVAGGPQPGGARPGGAPPPPPGPVAPHRGGLPPAPGPPRPPLPP